MAHWIGFVLGIEFFAIVLLMYGLISFFNATKKFDYELKIAFYLIIGALALQIVQGATIGLLLVKQVVHDHVLCSSCMCATTHITDSTLQSITG